MKIESENIVIIDEYEYIVAEEITFCHIQVGNGTPGLRRLRYSKWYSGTPTDTPVLQLRLPILQLRLPILQLRLSILQSALEYRESQLEYRSVSWSTGVPFGVPEYHLEYRSLRSPGVPFPPWPHHYYTSNARRKESLHSRLNRI
jgi:hypothetical protein